MRRQVSHMVWFYVALWLAAFAPLTCYRHGFLPAYFQAEQARNVPVGLPFVIDDMCGTGTLPPPEPPPSHEPHNHAHKTLLLSAVGLWQPALPRLIEPQQPAISVQLTAPKPQIVDLALPKPPPRLS